MKSCRRCGQENPDIARFCLACGTALSEEPRRAEVRKRVTVVFADIVGSTSLVHRLEPESLRRVMDRYFESMRDVIERHGGTVEKFIGDAVMAVFGIPVLHEDDALRAVRAATEMRDSLGHLNIEFERSLGVAIQIRIGVDTGEVVAGDPAGGQAFATGDAVNVAARLQEAAQPMEILVGQSTYRLARDVSTVEPVGQLALKGRTDEVTAYRLLAVAKRPDRARVRPESPLVGREHELELLSTAFEAVVRSVSGRLVMVIGGAGVGKSRLVEEFLTQARRPRDDRRWPLPALRQRHHVLADQRGDQ
jgi:class 3 adenylate cyclase